MKITRLATGLVVGLVLCANIACSNTTTIRVPVAPRVDLGQFQTIGLVTFSSNEADADLRRDATRQFLQAMQDAQPGTRILELGEDQRVLGSVDREKFDRKTLALIQEQHGVDALIVGSFDLEKHKPDVNISSVWKALSVKADITGTLNVRMLETSTGATMWSDSSQTTVNVANAQFFGKGQGHIGARDAEEAFTEMLGCLVPDVTEDFRTQYITKRVPKEQLAGGQQQTASADR